VGEELTNESPYNIGGRMKVEFTKVADAIRLLEYCGLTTARFDESTFDAVVDKGEVEGYLHVQKMDDYYTQSKNLIGQVGHVKLYNLGKTF
jgi:hypothetical protein